jgi:hypothetical protein
MSEFRSEIDQLLQRAKTMAHGQAQVAVTDEAVRLADVHSDVEYGFKARQEHVHSTTFAGLPEQALVAFSWCLSQYDRAPAKHDTHMLLWQYKWVVNNLPNFPQISRTQIEDMIADMTRRFEQNGASMHTIWHRRRSAAVDMGDRTAAEEADREMKKHPRDRLSDCFACELDSNSDYLFFLGKDAEGVADARRIINGGYSCSGVPHWTYAQLLLPLLRLQQGEEAMRYHRLGYKMVSGIPGRFILPLARHMQFLALTANFPKAFQILQKNMPSVLETSGLTWRFGFYVAVLILLERVAETGRSKLKLRLPKEFPPHNETGEYGPQDLIQWFRQQLDDMANRFDTRDGNNYYRGRIGEIPNMKALAVDIPLRVRKDGEAPEE